VPSLSVPSSSRGLRALLLLSAPAHVSVFFFAVDGLGARARRRFGLFVY
jgi:hypothetical protein